MVEKTRIKPLKQGGKTPTPSALIAADPAANGRHLSVPSIHLRSAQQAGG